MHPAAEGATSNAGITSPSAAGGEHILVDQQHQMAATLANRKQAPLQPPLGKRRLVRGQPTLHVTRTAP